MRGDLSAKVVLATCCVGIGLIAFRAVRLAGVSLVLAGKMVRNRREADVAGQGEDRGSRSARCG